MFQTNTAKEILYIFLWLVGIILLYGLVHSFILEPHNTSHTHAEATKDTSSVHEKQTSVKKVVAHKAIKVATPVAVAKAPKVIKVAQTLVTKQVEKIQKIETHPTITPDVKKVPTKEVVNAKVSVEKMPSVPQVPKLDVEKVPTKETISAKVSVKKTPSISTPTVPQAPKMVTTPKSSIKIPTIPTVPTVLTTSTSQKISTETPKVITEQENEKKEITKATEALEKELSQDEKMELVEKARQMVIDEAEKARNEALKAIER